MMYERVLKPFGIEFRKIRKDIRLEGSPERCRSRAVIEAKDKNVYIIELLKNKQKEQRENIAKTLMFLKLKGMKEVNPYIYHEGFIHYDWMVQKYIENIPLKRPDYINELWRAKKIGRFLHDLKRIEVPYFDKKDIFDIKEYVREIQSAIDDNRPELGKITGKYARFVEKNLPSNLPISFSHGDFHPINILWGEDEIISVIDWEFCGYKHEIYDLANLLGCIGSEDPKNLESEFATTLINNMKKVYSDKSIEHLNVYILALRFGWLSEWLRKKDEEMVNQEIEYMKLIR